MMTLLDLQDYFQGLAEAHPDIRDFVVGDSELILSEDRSKLTYPVLWLETPLVRWRYQPGPARRFYQLSFVVLLNSTIDTPEKEQYILSRTLEITAELLAKLNNDLHDGPLAQGTRPTRWGSEQPISDAVLGYGVDNDHGWRTTISLEVAAINYSCDGLFVSACDPALRASFVWANAGTGSAFVITISQVLPSDGAWAYEWAWHIDGGNTTTSGSAPSGALGSGGVLYVVLKATLGSCVLMASAVIVPGRVIGASVPGLFHPQHAL